MSDVYPALSVADPDRFGIAVMGVTGAIHVAGDSGAPFSIMSVAKPFVFALACSALGPDEVRARVGVNATGLPFNALSAVERSPDGRTNPMVNPGAIATTALVAGGAPVPERGSGSWRACRRSRAVGSPSTTTSTSRRSPRTTATARWPSSSTPGVRWPSTPTRPSSSTPGRAASR